MKRIGMKVDKHHHEVASCQHELGLIFDSLTKQADELQKYKYVIQNVAHAYGKSATFVPNLLQATMELACMSICLYQKTEASFCR